MKLFLSLAVVQLGREGLRNSFKQRRLKTPHGQTEGTYKLYFVRCRNCNDHICAIHNLLRQIKESQVTLPKKQTKLKILPRA